MTVLCDWEIRERCEQSQMLVPFDPDLLNPASIDVILGNFLMVETIYQKDLLRIEISKATEDDPFKLLPGNFCLAETSEVFNIPDDISAQFVLKSSRARQGYNHMLAGWIDPGFHGSRLTLELKNETKYTDLPLYPGLKIGQIVFHKMNNVPQASYAITGNYNNHLTVMPSVA